VPAHSPPLPPRQRFRSQVASDAAEDQWATYDGLPVAGRLPGIWITFQTLTPAPWEGGRQHCGVPARQLAASAHGVAVNSQGGLFVGGSFRLREVAG